jgi:glycosyltransferase involved in cell wall biosynthesis
MPSVSSTNPNQATKPIRILHVVGGMDRGGVETWLMHVLRQLKAGASSSDTRRFQMDFLAPEDRHYAYTDELQALGSQIFPCLGLSKPLLYAANFQRILREHGPYDAVHVHVHHFSGYVLHLARQAGIKVRIIHSHIDTSSIESNVNWSRKFYNTLMKWWIDRNATIGLAASQMAAADLLNPTWENDSRWRILCCGIDLAPFRDSIALRRAYAFDKTKLRAEFEIPADALVIGHVGRFEPQKNHHFLLEIAAEVAKIEPNIRLVLLGIGSLRAEIEAKAVELGLADRVLFLGTRPDVPRLMIGLMDIFLFPSLYEGLGLVSIEAQAAGIPCILADTVPPEADLVTPLVQRLSLHQPASEWAAIVLNTSANLPEIDRASALEIVAQSVFNIDVSVAALTKFYDGAIADATANANG